MHSQILISAPKESSSKGKTSEALRVNYPLLVNSYTLRIGKVYHHFISLYGHALALHNHLSSRLAGFCRYKAAGTFSLPIDKKSSFSSSSCFYLSSIKYIKTKGLYTMIIMIIYEKR